MQLAPGTIGGGSAAMWCMHCVRMTVVMTIAQRVPGTHGGDMVYCLDCWESVIKPRMIKHGVMRDGH